MDDLCEGRTSYYHQQYRVKSANVKGLTYWEESYATIADRDVDGNPVKIVGTTMFINDRKEMEAALIAARNKAEESDRLKTAFLANMGHEIRTPLNAIVGFADLLPVVENEEDRNQLIREIQNNNQKLLRIIDGLVSMSKIEAEAKNLVKSQTNLVEVLSEITQTYMQMVDSQTVVLATQFPYTELMMTTDVAKLRELVDHLMQNAVKFTLKGSITLGFELIDGEHVRIWVKDTGKGIAEADKERIFERFVKVDEYIPGTGLGLSVAKSHAASLGGTIGVDSRPGEGSTFWVVLPLT
jgi:signal transduction histidine kinase